MADIGTLIVLAFALWRLALRARRGSATPEAEAELSTWELRVSAWGHTALHMLLLVVPALGYLTACTAPSGVPTLFLWMIPIPALVGPNPGRFTIMRVAHRWAAVALIVLARATR
jgi:cytochrome b561